MSARLAAASRHYQGVCADAFIDVFECRPLGPALIFECGATHPAGIGDEVRQCQHAALLQRLLGFQRARNIGALPERWGSSEFLR